MGGLMRCARRLVLLAAAVSALTALAAPHARAALPSCTPALPRSISSAHFMVSYTDDPTAPNYVSEVQAGAVLAAAERSYASYTGMTFPPPTVGGSGKTELYLLDLSTFHLSAIYCNGSADLDAATVLADLDYNVASTIFNEIEYLYGGTDSWLMNGAAAWAAWHSLGYPSESISDLGPFDVSLDCSSAYDKANCSKTGGENLGVTRWPFFEYLAEKFGNPFIIDIFNAASTAGSGLAGLQNALAAKGTTLSAEYGAYAGKLLSGGWTATPLNVATIPISGTKIQTGISSGAVAAQSFGVNHLATKFVEIDRGDGSGSHACYAASLTLTVQIPAGVTSQPTFYWTGGGSTAVPLAVSGSTATATVPWDTCAWQNKGYLSLPNTSLVDGTSFTVSGTLTVDFTKPASSAVPPAQSSQYGQTVDASTVSSVPTLSLFGPQLLRLASNASQLRLIVQSNAEGRVSASLGSVSLGTFGLRPGGNDLRLALPAGILTRLRASASTSVLTLTPTALDGTAGAVISRTIAVTPAKTVKPKKRLRRK
jgi:hypothetical protein